MTFTPGMYGDAAATLTFSGNATPTSLAVALVGMSPTTVSLTLGSKTYILPYPSPILGLPDTDPSKLTTHSTASLWPLVAGVNSFAKYDSRSVPLPSPQLIAAVPWPINFRYWIKKSGNPFDQDVYGATGCAVDLVGSNLVVTANGESISAAVDGTPPVLNTIGQIYHPGDVLVAWAGQRTVGVLSVVRSIEIQAFEGDLQALWRTVTVSANYDSHGSLGPLGPYGQVRATNVTSIALTTYICSDEPTLR